MKKSNWLQPDTMEGLKGKARETFEIICMGHKEYNSKECEEMFTFGFLEGINFLRDSIEIAAKEKERPAATERPAYK